MDKALKQRLVGASVLIILAVIVLPMLLSGRSDTLKQESREIELPPKPEELSIETRRFPVGVPSKPVADTLPDPVEDKQGDVQDSLTFPDQDQLTVAGQDIAATGSNALDTSVQPAIEGQGSLVDASQPEVMTADVNPETETLQTASIEKPPAVTSVTLSSGPDKNLDIPVTDGKSPDSPRYLVQVASFSSEKNANALAGRLQADNLPVLMDVVDRPAGRLHRVRVGPYADRADADAVVSSLSSSMGELTPRVLDLRPKESSPVSAPSDPLVRWVVQVGSFGSSTSADKLVAELQLAGLSAFSEKVSSAGGTVYKVRIGPELNRDKAAELARKVKTDHKLDGFVTTQE
jgi:DedD protein